MKQIRFIEWAHPDLCDGSPFLVTVATMLGMYWAGYRYDHEGD